MTTQKVKKAVIPAAGYGTRFLPVTKAIAKEMFPIINKPAIHLIVEEAVNSGIEEILIIDSAAKSAIAKYFNRDVEFEQRLLNNGKIKEYNEVVNIGSDVKISFVEQKEQLGLGHAVLQARSFVGEEPFALLLGDNLYSSSVEPVTKRLIAEFEKSNHAIIGTMWVSNEDVSKFGICDLLDSNEQVTSIISVVEKPTIEEAPSNIAIAGRYIFNANIFDYLENEKRGLGGEIQLTDSISAMLKNEPIDSYLIKDKRYDIGSRVGFIEAVIDFAIEHTDIRDEVINLIKEKNKSF